MMKVVNVFVTSIRLHPLQTARVFSWKQQPLLLLLPPLKKQVGRRPETIEIEMKKQQPGSYADSVSATCR
jgi:hypothetical protein